MDTIESRYNNCCAVCSAGDIASLQRDHIIPKSLGGSNDDSNIQILCYVCNSKLKRATEIPFRFTTKLPKYDSREWVDSRREFAFLIKHIRLDSLASLYEYNKTKRSLYVMNRKLYLDIVASEYTNDVYIDIYKYSEYIADRITKFISTHTTTKDYNEILFKLGWDNR